VNTSGEGTANIILYLVVLALFVQVAIRMVPRPLSQLPFPWFGAVATVVIGIPSLLQFAWPSIDSALRRNPAETLDHGQWWRVLTAMLAQDGGAAGAIFNLLVVALVTCTGEWIWGRWRAIALFVVPSIVLNLLAIGWGASGGGSSFASDALLMSLCGLGLVTVRNLVVRICATAAIVVGVALIGIDDAHGVAMLIGAAAGVALGFGSRRTVGAGGGVRSRFIRSG
jgi:hypothetical protein